VVPWLPGRAADLFPPDAGQASRLADFLRALHQPAPTEAPRNPVRGVPLDKRRQVVEERLARLRGHPAVTDAVHQAWNDALTAAPAEREGWLHGDLHPRNVLVSEGRLAAIIDWGDLTNGDPATDLAAVWMLFGDPGARREVIARYGGSADDWRRARGWAVSFGAVLLETGLADNPRHAAIGAATLQRLAAPPTPMHTR
jgi:aminoglycoside phosphotransferase (APT) family kinase protein